MSVVFLSDTMVCYYCVYLLPFVVHVLFNQIRLNQPNRLYYPKISFHWFSFWFCVMWPIWRYKFQSLFWYFYYCVFFVLLTIRHWNLNWSLTLFTAKKIDRNRLDSDAGRWANHRYVAWWELPHGFIVPNIIQTMMEVLWAMSTGYW